MSEQQADIKNKTLVLRLSSLGDVIIAASVLQTNNFQSGVDWVVAKEYSALLQHHPRVKNLWVFNRSSGLSGWIELARILWEQHYNFVFDLHGSLRTKIMYLLFYFWSLGKRAEMPQWKTINKKYLKRYGCYLFKQYWPEFWRPVQWVTIYSRFVGGNGQERPDLNHLLQEASGFWEPWMEKPYFCVMPSSKWPGKQWPVQKYFEVLKKSGTMPVILGTESDDASLKLLSMLQQHGIPCVSGVAKWDLLRVAHVLAGARGYLGSDTGLAHLAEAVGTPAWIIFGPTVPELGFAPWRQNSCFVGSNQWCRPCGKDGRYCYYFFIDPHRCLKRLDPATVLRGVNKCLVNDRVFSE